MAATAAATYMSVDQGEVFVTGTITLTGVYGGAASHGDTLNISALTYQKLLLPVNVVGNLLYFEIVEMPAAGSAASGYDFVFCPGTTLANGRINISSATTEYTQASGYSAPLLASVLRFTARFKVQ